LPDRPVIASVPDVKNDDVKVNIQSKKEDTKESKIEDTKE
jgi:hypothetical protein